MFTMNGFKIAIITSYVLAIVGLFFYSYTQVDLSLTLSQVSFYQVVEKAFQYVGYFQRPLSTSIFLSLLFLLYTSYIGLFVMAKKNRLSRKTVWVLILLSIGILTFSYNAFSYDLFNYIFDAKIITHYHLNPYLYKALDFPHEPMLSFMHWVERTYPYGPLWLVMTVPLSFVGFQFFLPTFFLFKILMGVSFLGSCWLVEKIVKEISPKQSLSSLVFFAFNPLLLIEGVVSAHNDIVMMAVALWAVYLLIQQKSVRSLFILILSIGIKFATIFLLPIFLLVFSMKWRKLPIEWKKVFLITALVMVIPVVAASLRTNFQPWYLLYMLPFVALSSEYMFLVLPMVAFSLFALLEYAPFLFKGDWNQPVPGILTLLLGIGLGVSILLAVVALLQKPRVPLGKLTEA
jgi:hypothetical protein